MIYRPYRLLLILLVWFLVATRPLPLQAETDQPTPTPAMPAALARISANNANKVALLKTFTEPKVWVVGVTFSPNGALFAGVEDGGNVYVWQTATSKLIGQINYV